MPRHSNLSYILAFQSHSHRHCNLTRYAVVCRCLALRPPGGTVLTPSGFSPQVLRAFPLSYFSSCTSYRQVSYRQVHRAHLFRYSVLIPMLGAAITYAQVAKLRISMFTSLLPAHPAQVFCAHPCSVTPFSPCSGTLCSPERAGCTMLILCSPCSGTLCSPC